MLVQLSLASVFYLDSDVDPPTSTRARCGGRRVLRPVAPTGNGPCIPLCRCLPFIFGASVLSVPTLAFLWRNLLRAALIKRISVSVSLLARAPAEFTSYFKIIGHLSIKSTFFSGNSPLSLHFQSKIPKDSWHICCNSHCEKSRRGLGKRTRRPCKSHRFF